MFSRADIFLHTKLTCKTKPVALKKTLDRATKMYPFGMPLERMKENGKSSPIYVASRTRQQPCRSANERGNQKEGGS